MKFAVGSIAAGGSAGVTTLILTYPLSYASIRLSTDIGSGKDRKFTGILDCLKKSIA